MKTGEPLYGRTAISQLLFDIGFTKSSVHYLSRKHGLPVETIRRYRAAFRRGMRQAETERVDRNRRNHERT